LGERPFELVKAPQEISSGTMVEYGGKYLALATIEHAFSLFVGTALFVNLFLGGSSNPGFFIIKVIVVFIVEVLINAVFPRFRVDQAIKYLWRWPTLVALAGLILVFIIER
jgi:NADH-quinone oxidoreductase subunit H